MAAASRTQHPWSPLYASQNRMTSTRAPTSPMRLAVGAAIRSPGRLAAAVHRAGHAFDPCPPRVAFPYAPAPRPFIRAKDTARKGPGTLCQVAKTSPMTEPRGAGGHVHFATGGSDINTALASWPVSSPNFVPRS